MNASDPGAWVPIRRAPAQAAMAELGLVLTATDIPHRIEFDGHAWTLEVAWLDREAAETELATYQRENRPTAAPPAHPPVIDSGWLGVLGYLLIIWALPSLEAAVAFGWNWREAGVMAAAPVRGGEWWRTITALTLHGDLAHLLGNSLFGGLFGLYVGRYLGSGVGWLLVLLGGALGNAANAWIQPDAFRSLGASTATFAALALVSAFVWRRGYVRGMGWRRRFAPVFGGIAMLAFTGFGGDNTDVIAHITGFGAGILLGVCIAVLPVERLGRAVQTLSGLLALALVAIAWAYAGGAYADAG